MSSTIVETPSKTMPVAAIRNGTVLDHIPSGLSLRILRLLMLHSRASIVTVGLHLPSNRLGKKDLIKAEGWEISGNESGHVALFARMATVNIISNYEVIRKFSVTLPEEVVAIFICPHERCITRFENIPSTFIVQARKGQCTLQCKYCRKVYSHEDLKEMDSLR